MDVVDSIPSSPLRQGVQVMEPKKAVPAVSKLMPKGFPIICCDRFGSGFLVSRLQKQSSSCFLTNILDSFFLFVMC